MIPNKFYFGKKGFKYCIGYKDDDRVKPLCTSGFVKSFAEPKFMQFLIKDEELSKKSCLKSGIKSAISLKNRFDSDPVYNENYLKAKINLMNVK